MSKSRKALMKLIYVALFTALCFVGTMIFLPIGTSKMHLGNLFCILAGLLCGGWVGGLAGALGMGLNDIVFGYPYTVYVRTFILKFLMGFISGTLFRALIRHHVKGNLLLYITSFLLSALYIYIVVCYCTAVKGFSFTLLIVSSILEGLLLFLSVFSFRLDNILKCLSFSMLVSLTVNVIGEFYLRILFNSILGMTYEEARLTSVAALPGSFFTSLITIVILLPTFYPIYRATRKINVFNDLEEYMPQRSLERSKPGDTKKKGPIHTSFKNE